MIKAIIKPMNKVAMNPKVACRAGCVNMRMPFSAPSICASLKLAVAHLTREASIK